MTFEEINACKLTKKNHVNLKKALQITKKKLRAGTLVNYELYMGEYVVVNGQAVCKHYNDVIELEPNCNTTCCAIGWYAAWGVGLEDTGKEPYMQKETGDFFYRSYSSQVLAEDMTLRTYLFGCENENDWDALIGRMEYVIDNCEVV